MTSKYSTRYGDSEYVSTPEKNGCYLSKTTFCIICVVFIALLVGVALIFYFGPEETPSDCDVAVCVAPFPAVPGEPVEEEEPSFTGRLPESLKPYHYNLVVRVFLDEEDGDAQFTFDGNVTISITCVETTNVITLHAFDIEVDPLETLITDMQGTEIGISSQTIDELHEFYIIELKTSLKAGEEYSAYLTFEGILGRELHGLYRSSYNDPETKWLVASQFQATGARKMFPCFDEPNMKATFDMVIVHRDTRNALWNMPLVKTVPTYDNWLESHFETSVIMPTYLLAVVVSDFPYLEIVREDGLV
ncbi:aminopeptidase N-like, partial [Saccoglossus kowalevskii]